MSGAFLILLGLLLVWLAYTGKAQVIFRTIQGK